MSKIKKPINSPDEHADSQKIQRWSVWTQGPKDAKETQRKFKLTTPGQTRDYKKLVGNRKFQRFEQVESVTPKKEETPANSVGGGGVDMAPNAGPPSKTTKVFMKRRRKPRRVDGRTKAYRETIKRIKERHLKKAQKEIEQRYSHFAAQATSYAEELDMSNKYLNTKEGSLEQAVLQSLATEATPNSEKDTLTLPENKYLDSPEGSLEWASIKSITEEAYKLPRQLKDPKKEKMVGTKKGTKVVDKNDPKYKKHPEHESLEVEGIQKKHEKGDKQDEVPEKRAGESDKDHEDRVKGRISFKSHRKSLDKVDPDELKGKHKDRDDKDIDNDGDVDKSDQYLHRRRQAIASKRSKGKKQNFRDKDDEAQATRSKKEPTAEANTGPAVKDRSELDKQIAAYKAKGGKIKKIKSPERSDRDKLAAQRPDVGKMGSGGEGRAKPKKAHEETEVDEVTMKSASGSQTMKSGKKVPGHWKKMTPDEVKSRLAKERGLKMGEEVEIDELSKATLGRYVKKASDSKVDAGMALQRTADKNQTRGDVDKHLGKVMKRGRGISKAVDKLSKEEVKVGAIHAYYRSKMQGEKWDPSVAGKDDHATALYKDQWRDRSRADWDKAHGKDAMAKQDRADAGEDRKRMKVIDPKWKHAKYETGEKQNGPNEAKDREIGTDEYAKYTKDMTPGQPQEVPAVGIDNKQAK